MSKIEERKIITAKIRARREQLGYSLKELADKMNWDWRTIQKIETNQWNVSIGKLLELCEQLELKILIEDKPIPEEE